jgi:hypothetical protein
VDGGRDEPDLPADNGAEDPDADAEAEEGVVEEEAVPAVGGQVACVAGDLVAVLGHLAVQGHVGELHHGEALTDRRVRIALDVGEGVVLAMDGGPLAGPDAGRDPDHDAEHPRGAGGEGDGAVTEATVQPHRRQEEGHGRKGESEDHRQDERHEVSVPPYLPVGRREPPL